MRALDDFVRRVKARQILDLREPGLWEGDCLIAACAIRHDLEMLQRERDYTVIAEVSSLRRRMP